MMYQIRRYSASHVFYGERIYEGTRRECLQYMQGVVMRREGWEHTRTRNTWEFTHDERADVHTFVMEKAE